LSSQGLSAFGSGDVMTEFDILLSGVGVGFGLYCFFSLLGYAFRELIKIFYK